MWDFQPITNVTETQSPHLQAEKSIKSHELGEKFLRRVRVWGRKRGNIFFRCAPSLFLCDEPPFALADFPCGLKWFHLFLNFHFPIWTMDLITSLLLFPLPRYTDTDHLCKVLSIWPEMGSIWEEWNLPWSRIPFWKTKTLSLQPNILSYDGRFLFKAVSSFCSPLREKMVSSLRTIYNFRSKGGKEQSWQKVEVNWMLVHPIQDKLPLV